MWRAARDETILHAKSFHGFRPPSRCAPRRSLRDQKPAVPKQRAVRTAEAVRPVRRPELLLLKPPPQSLSALPPCHRRSEDPSRCRESVRGRRGCARCPCKPGGLRGCFRAPTFMGVFDVKEQSEESSPRSASAEENLVKDLESYAFFRTIKRVT
jgi:hypothetical protein